MYLHRSDPGDILYLESSLKLVSKGEKVKDRNGLHLVVHNYSINSNNTYLIDRITG